MNKPAAAPVGRPQSLPSQRNRLITATWVVVLGLAWLWCWWPLLAGKVVLIMGDLSLYWLPSKSYAAQRLGAFELPLWIPHIGLGMPYLADISHQLFYPLNLIFAGPWEVPKAIGYFVAAHVGLGMVACYRLVTASVNASLAERARATGVALWGAALFGFSGVVVSSTTNLTYLPAIVWVPLGLSVALRHGPTFTAGLRVGGCMAMMILAGDAINTGLLALAAMGIWLTVRRPSAPDPRASNVRFMPAAIALVGLPLALCAIQLLPLWDLVGQSARGGSLPAEEIGAWSFHPHRISELVQPFLYGARYPGAEYFGAAAYPVKGYPWFASVYLGLIPIGLAGLAGISRSHGAGTWVTIVAVALLASMGAHLPGFEDWITHLPVISSQRYPEKLLLWVNIGLCALAATGAMEALRRIAAARASSFSIALIAITSILFVGLWASLELPYSGDLALLARAPSQWWHDKLGFEVSTVDALRIHALVICLLAGAVIVSIAGAKSARFSYVLFTGALALAVIDLLWLHSSQIPVGKRDSLTLSTGPAALDVLHAPAEDSPVRVAYSGAKLFLAPGNQSLWTQIENQFADRLFPLYGVRHGLTYLNADFSPLASRSRLEHVRRLLATGEIEPLREAAVQFIVTGAHDRDPKWDSPGYIERLNDRERDVRILEVTRSKSRFSILEGGTERQLVPTVSKPEFHQFALPGATERSRLVVRETFASGWRATVDGRVVDIASSPDQFMWIDLPAGAGQVTLEYRSAMLMPGLAVSVLALIAWITWELHSWMRRLRKPPNQRY